MSRTLTALFDSRQDAEAAKQRLQAASIDINHVHIHDQSSSGFSASDYSTHQNRGFWAEVKNAFLPDEDRHTYEEGVRRGGFLLTADIDEDSADEAVRILEQANTIDIDQRASEWRSSGWDYQGGNAASGSGAGSAGGSGSGSAFAFGNGQTGETTGNEQRIPIVEEELKVGKREVNRGGVRVRSYVVETPVHEQVTLRDEHVSVERRPTDRAVTGSDDAFRERSVEMTETSEEAVVAKEARVREELVVRKEVGSHVEEIDDTVRRTEVDIDRDNDRERDLSAGERLTSR